LNENTFAMAAFCCNVEMMEWCYKNNCLWDYEALQILKDYIKICNEHVHYKVVEIGNLEILF
jgi:hypothetical protein